MHAYGRRVLAAVVNVNVGIFAMSHDNGNRYDSDDYKVVCCSVAGLAWYTSLL
jgi:hypothetical protein